ncbi:MAG: hypothetical protein NZ902_04135 [Acidilobaceae archaeon]|nr:hypothetical protein [Acidilobaceae archaeon]MCX8165081.1 hypothetical protein [Acidilobaceae archaeon]MDW7974402.1 hypothetical protein [Sulfolobales archaeon]
MKELTEYLEQLRDLIKEELSKYGLTPSLSKEALNIMRAKDVVMTIRDLKDYVELSYKGKKYSYDKWYTKPQHLASTIINTLKVQEKTG